MFNYPGYLLDGLVILTAITMLWRAHVWLEAGGIYMAFRRIGEIDTIYTNRCITDVMYFCNDDHEYLGKNAKNKYKSMSDLGPLFFSPLTCREENI